MIYCYTDLAEIENDLYKEITFINSSNDLLIFTQCNDKNDDIIVNDNGINFDGTQGLELNKRGYIDLNKNYFIEIDFSISSDNGDDSYYHTLMSVGLPKDIDQGRSAEFNNNISIYASVNHNYIGLFGYNTVGGTYLGHSVTCNLEYNVKYNLKIFRFGAQLYMYVNNLLLTSEYYETSNYSGGSLNTYYANKILRLGQDNANVATNNLIGKIYNVKISDLKTFNGRVFEPYADNLLHAFSLYGTQNMYAGYMRIRGINDYGVRSMNAYYYTYTGNIPQLANSDYFVDVGNGKDWWYKTSPTSTSRFYINDNIFNNEKASLLVKMKTESTLKGFHLIDCRSSASTYDGLVIVYNAESNYFTFFIGNADKNMWAYEINSDPNPIEIDTIYEIKIIKNGNNFKLKLNDTNIIDFNFINENVYLGPNKIVFFNTANSTIYSANYFRDLRLYNTVVEEYPEIDDHLIVSYDTKLIEMNTSIPIEKNYKFENASLIKFDENLIKTINHGDNSTIMKSLDDTYQPKDYYIFAEGHPEYHIDLYKGDKLVLREFNNKNITITNSVKHDYYYIIKETNVKRYINKSMILSYLEININTMSCSGSDFYVRLLKSDTGEFIGNYELENNFTTIYNLEYTSYYDAILIDRNKILENRVRSSLRPKLMHIDSNINRESFFKVRELSKYEASLIFENSIQNNQSLYSVYLQNTNKSISKFKILNYIGNLYDVLGTINNKEILRLKNTINDSTKTINIDGKISNRIVKNSLIEIDDETMFVLNVDNNEITVNRGILFSLPNKHYTGSIIKILSECYFIEEPSAESYINYINVDENNIESTINSEKIIYTKSNNKLKSECFPGNIQINGNKINDSIKLIDDFTLSWNYKEDTDDWFDIKNTPSNITYDIEIISTDNSSIYYENVQSPLTISETDITSYKTKLRLITCKNGIKSPFAFNIELESQPGLLNLTLDNENLIPNLTYQNNIIMED